LFIEIFERGAACPHVRSSVHFLKLFTDRLRTIHDKLIRTVKDATLCASKMSALPSTFVPGFHNVSELRNIRYTKLGKTDMVLSNVGIGGAAFGEARR
jgi:hypothetical protein